MQQQKSGPRDLESNSFFLVGSGQCLYPAQTEWLGVNTIYYVDMFPRHKLVYSCLHSKLEDTSLPSSKDVVQIWEVLCYAVPKDPVAHHLLFLGAQWA